MQITRNAQHQFTSQDAKAVIDLAEFAYIFCEVNRATFLPDGKTPESDGTHAVVLTLIGAALAKRFYPHLDAGLVVQLSMVHDLVEAYAGDTPTLKITMREREAKEKREHAALKKIESNFGSTFPELIELIHAYERQDTPEAKFVKMLDKLMPMLSHILNSGTTLHKNRITRDEFKQIIKDGTEEYTSSEFGRDNSGLISLRKSLLPYLEQSAYGSVEQTY